MKQIQTRIGKKTKREQVVKKIAEVSLELPAQSLTLSPDNIKRLKYLPNKINNLKVFAREFNHLTKDYEKNSLNLSKKL